MNFLASTIIGNKRPQVEKKCSFVYLCCMVAILSLHLPSLSYAFQTPTSRGIGSISIPTKTTTTFVTTFERQRPSSSSTTSTRFATSLNAFQWPTLPAALSTNNNDSTTTSKAKANTEVGERNGLDSDYPWRFEGRFIFRPSFVRVSKDVQPPSANLLSLFGYSLGGSVVLEYDVSPVGPYTEYVSMGGVVGLGNVNIGGTNGNTVQKSLGVGQWGTNLYVSNQIAEDVCQDVWGVPAQVANIDLIEGGKSLADGPEFTSKDGKRNFLIKGWDNARVLNEKENGDDTTTTTTATAKRYGNIPIFWTPTIKALWAPLIFSNNSIGGGSKEEDKLLPLHKLRLSASAIRLKWCERRLADEGEFPLGLALVVDNVLIEIGERVTSGSV